MEFCPSSGEVHPSTVAEDPSILKAFKVYNFILSRGGEVELSELSKPPSPLAKLSRSKIWDWLQEFSELAQGDKELEKPCFALQSKETNIVKVCVRVKLCSVYEQNSSCKHGPKCLQWHICREFLSGNCFKDKDCSRSHDFFDVGNIKKVQKFRLEKHSNSCIRKVLAKNLPFLCDKYVLSNGCSNPNCEFIHLCPRHVKGTCEKNENDCPLQLSHSADDDNNRAIFKQFGVPAKYVLAHVLFPKTIPQQTQGQDSSKIVKMIGHEGKVKNLNNLDIETQAHKMVRGNVALNIHQNVTSKSNKQRRAMNEGKASSNHDVSPNVVGVQKHEKAIQGKSKVPSKSVPQLMHLKTNSPDHPQYSKPFPSLPCDPSASQAPASESQKKQKEFKKKKVKITSKASQEEHPFGSKENLTRSDFGTGEIHDYFEMPQSPGIILKGKRSSKGFERPSNIKPLDEKEIKKEVCAKDIEPSEQDTQPKNSKRQRRRQLNLNKKKSSQQDDVDGANQEEKEEKGADIDLIQFNEDDYPINEEKLIDLEVDICDPGLSQMSEAQSRAMWDLFSQDLLYSQNDDDSSLSQSSDLTQELSDTTPQPNAIKNASADAIFNCLVMKYGGTAKFSEISNNEQLWDPCFNEKEQWFRKRKAMFLLVEDSRGKINVVKAMSFRARMCFKYDKLGSCTKEGCPYFHICKEFITNGRCKNYGGSCKKSHTFREGHNKEVAVKLFPGIEYTNQHLRQLILSSTLQVCMDYNNFCCQLGKRCTKVHVCKNFGYKRCPKGQCQLLHQRAFSNDNVHTKSLLAKFRVRLDPNKVNFFVFAKTLLQVDREDKTSTASAYGDACKMSGEVGVKSGKKESVEKMKPSQTDSTQYNINADSKIPICLAFLIGKCDKGNKCNDHHCPLPYQWIYKSSNNKWKMIEKDKNIEIEKFYCEDNISNPSGDFMLSMKLDLSSNSLLHNAPFIYSINFKDMQIGSLDETGVHIPIKRLSTSSSVIIPGCCLATEWFWYWKNEHGVYEEYKTCNDSDKSMSKTIEGFYQEGMSRYDFSTINHQYRLYFNDMYQKNMDPKYHTKRDVMRRPQFISLKKFYHLKSSCKLPEDLISSSMPSHWKRMTESQTLLLKRLNANSKEYKDIKSLFVNSMGNRKVSDINGIDRVQNPFMWEKYSRKKDQMLRRSKSREVDERQLFHGTSYKNIRSICQNNFDWRLSGEVTGDIYGKGTYFARDASFSHCYCHDDEDGIRYVFIAKVLVGSYTEGKKEYLLPPPKNPDDPHSDKYDSCVDNVNNPQVFVVSDNDQYYPEYVIEYSSDQVEDQASRSVKHRHSDPMGTDTLLHWASADHGASMMTSSTPNLDPYSQFSCPSSQAASMSAGYSTSHDQYPVGGSYYFDESAPSATANSSPQCYPYSTGSYPIGQSASVRARPSSRYSLDPEPPADEIIDIGASTARYSAPYSTSQATSRPRASEHYSRSTSVPPYTSSNPGLQYQSRSTPPSHLFPGQTSLSRKIPDVRPGVEPVKKNDGCSVM